MKRLIPGILTAATAFVLVGAAPAAAAPAPAGRILVLDTSTGQGLVSVRARGGDVRSLHLQLQSYAYPDYSPDGTRVTYTDGWSLYTVDTSGGDRRWVIDGGSVPSHPRWAPNGREIGYEQGEIAAADIAVPGSRQIYHALDSGSLLFDWSPDGRQIAVVQSWAVGGEPWDPVYARDIWIVRADGSQVARRLTSRAEAWDVGRLAWSPNGRTLVAEALGDLWSIDVRTGATTNLTNTPGVAESSPIWSRDGRLVAFGRQPAGAAAPQVWLRPAGARGDTGRSLNIAGQPTSWH
jgi:TolB protein